MGRCPWFFSAVYASPREMERRELWAELEKISASCQGPWLVADDLNDIKCKEEQRGGVEPAPQKCKRFQENMDKCKLIDLGSEGPRFTWRGPVVGYAMRLFKRLDRALCNAAWKSSFGEAKVIVGPRIQSDHHPLVIKLEAGTNRIGERPFRFEAAWLTHEGFKDVVGRHWRHDIKTWDALKALEGDLQEWNVRSFGHIRQRKCAVIKRIEGIQRSIQTAGNPFLEELEGQLQNELRLILLQEEILWFQKARTKWLNDGDRNTSYYHLKTRIKRSRSCVELLKNEQNEWVEGKAQCGEVVNLFFQGLLREDEAVRPWLTTSHS